MDHGGSTFLVFLSCRNELQEEHYNDLRSELFKHIFMFSSGPRIVLTRLCIAVSVAHRFVFTVYCSIFKSNESW